MNCPVCNVTLVMSEKQGIEIDYCPACRGIWLDRGEIDKIIERSAGTQGHTHYNHQSHGHDGHEYKRHGYDKHRRKSFLEELFD